MEKSPVFKTAHFFSVGHDQVGTIHQRIMPRNEQWQGPGPGAYMYKQWVKLVRHMICRNLRSGPISAVLSIFSLTAILLKLDLIQTLTSLCSLRPDFGCNADWLLEQSATRSDWLLESMEVESAYSSRGCFREWLAVGGEKDRFSCLFLLFYGLIVRK